MGFRFWKRVNLLPGVTLNLSKSGPSVSVGPRGAKVTVGGRGARASVGIPGTGMFYTTNLTPKKAKSGARSRKPKAATAAAAPPAPTLPDEAAVPDNEKALVRGCRELAAGNEAAALGQLRQAAHLADGAYLAGVVALKANSLDEAVQYLTNALGRAPELGKQLGRYGVTPGLELPITEEVSAQVGPDERGVLLALTEAYQRQGHWAEAANSLQRLNQLEPDDVVVKLSLAELLLEQHPGDEQASRQALALAQGVENDSPVHTALLLYRARAMRTLGLLEAAEEVLAQALRRKKDRPAELMAGLYYERALLLEAQGQKEKAGADLQKAYALAPGYEDVAARLGL